MRIKHCGQRSAPTNPKHDAGRHFALQAKLAVCNLGGWGAAPTHVYPYAVPVTYKQRRRAVGAPASV